MVHDPRMPVAQAYERAKEEWRDEEAERLVDQAIEEIRSGSLDRAVRLANQAGERAGADGAGRPAWVQLVISLVGTAARTRR